MQCGTEYVEPLQQLFRVAVTSCAFFTFTHMHTGLMAMPFISLDLAHTCSLALREAISASTVPTGDCRWLQCQYMHRHTRARRLRWQPSRPAHAPHTSPYPHHTHTSQHTRAPLACAVCAPSPSSDVTHPPAHIQPPISYVTTLVPQTPQSPRASQQSQLPNLPPPNHCCTRAS